MRFMLTCLAFLSASFVHAQQPDAERKAMAILAEIQKTHEGVPIKMADETDAGVRAILAIFDKERPTEEVLVDLQKMTCKDQSSSPMRLITCGQAEVRWHELWGELNSVKSPAIYTEKYLPLALDKSAPIEMRASRAADINMFLTGNRGPVKMKIPTEVRIKLARGMAQLVGEDDMSLRRQGYLGCMHFGAGVKDAERAAFEALRSTDAAFRQIAFHLLFVGSKSDIQKQVGLGGVLDGEGRRDILDYAYKVVDEGSGQHPSELVAIGALSLAYLHRLDKEAPRIIALLKKLTFGDASALVRYRAFEGLHEISQRGSRDVATMARSASRGYDPREDEKKALGGPGPFSQFKPDDAR